MCQEVKDLFVCGYDISKVGLTLSIDIATQISLCMK